jgi:hypothetical protein
MRLEARLLSYTLRSDFHYRVLEGASHFIQSWVRLVVGR